MKKKAIATVACLAACACMTLGFAAEAAYASQGLGASSAGISSVLNSYISEAANTAGVSAVLGEYVAASNEESTTAAETTESAETTENAAAESAATVEDGETDVVASEYENMAVAQVDGYVRIRSEANTDSEILGKLYNNNVGTVLSIEGDWAYVQSGSVTGYISTDYLVIGDEDLFNEVSQTIATVNTETLRVRTEATTDAGILELVGEGESLNVVSVEGEWVKVSIDDEIGYVSAEYVDISMVYGEAESKEEEEERLAAEAAASASSYSDSGSSASYSYYYDGVDYATASAIISNAYGSDTGKAVAQYAIQFIGNPYVYGGSSLTGGTDCSGFVMSVYAAFGISLPHSSYSQRGYGYEVGTGDMQPGDVVCYEGHVGIYIGDGLIVHASNESTGIIVSSVYIRGIVSVRRMV